MPEVEITWNLTPWFDLAWNRNATRCMDLRTCRPSARLGKDQDRSGLPTWFFAISGSGNVCESVGESCSLLLSIGRDRFVCFNVATHLQPSSGVRGDFGSQSEKCVPPHANNGRVRPPLQVKATRLALLIIETCPLRVIVSHPGEISA